MRDYNPEEYAKACRPHADKEAADVAVEAFFDAVYKERKKHRIPDGVMIVLAHHHDTDKITTTAHMFMFGAASRREVLGRTLAVALLKPGVPNG